MIFISRLLVAVCYISSFPVFSENLLDELSLKAKATQFIEGSFVQRRIITVLPMPLNSSGLFSYDREQGIHWQTLQPIESCLRITSSEVLVNGDSFNNPGSAQFARILLSIFSGQYEILLEQFSLDASGDEKRWQLILTPRNDLVATRLIQILISGTDTVELVEIQEINGDKRTISFIVKRKQPVAP